MPVPVFVGIYIRRLLPRVRDLPNQNEDKILIPAGAELMKESEIRPYTDPGSQEARPP